MRARTRGGVVISHQAVLEGDHASKRSGDAAARLTDIDAVVSHGGVGDIDRIGKFLKQTAPLSQMTARLAQPGGVGANGGVADRRPVGDKAPRPIDGHAAPLSAAPEAGARAARAGMVAADGAGENGQLLAHIIVDAAAAAAWAAGRARAAVARDVAPH